MRLISKKYDLSHNSKKWVNYFLYFEMKDLFYPNRICISLSEDFLIIFFVTSRIQPNKIPGINILIKIKTGMRLLQKDKRIFLYYTLIIPLYKYDPK